MLRAHGRAARVLAKHFCMTEILHQIRAGMTGASWLEQVATVLGILGVVLMMRQNIWTFPVSLVQVTIFGYVCFQGQLYSGAVLQGMFFAALAYGWVHWTRGHSAENPLPVRWLGRRERIYYAAGAMVLWIGWGAIMDRMGAAVAYADAFVFATSVVSQWLQARKALENWLGWLLANTVAMGVFWTREYYWFAVLYFVFWCLAWGGFIAWRRSMRCAGFSSTPAIEPDGPSPANLRE
jgi:nicotinamide mononucleotide transporter